MAGPGTSLVAISPFSSRLVVSASAGVPVIGGVPQKIHDNGEAYSVSRDGTWLAFAANWGKFGYREVWVMKPDGDQAHKLCETDENHAFYGAEWSPDGQRLAYVILHEASDKAESAIESRDLKGCGCAAHGKIDRECRQSRQASEQPRRHEGAMARARQRIILR